MLIVTMIPTNSSNLQQLQQMVKDRESLLANKVVLKIEY